MSQIDDTFETNYQISDPTPTPEGPTLGRTLSLDLGGGYSIEVTQVNRADGGNAYIIIPALMDSPTNTLVNTVMESPISLNIGFQNGGLEGYEVSLSENELLSIIQIVYSTKLALNNIRTEGLGIDFPNTININIQYDNLENGMSSQNSAIVENRGQLIININMDVNYSNRLTNEERNLELSSHIRNYIISGLTRSYFRDLYNGYNDFEISELEQYFDGIENIDLPTTDNKVSGMDVLELTYISVRNLIQLIDQNPNLSYEQYLGEVGNTFLKFNTRSFEYFKNAVNNSFEDNYSNLFINNDDDFAFQNGVPQTVTLNQQVSIPSSTMNYDLLNHKDGGFGILEMGALIASFAFAFGSYRLYKSRGSSQRVSDVSVNQTKKHTQRNADYGRGDQDSVKPKNQLLETVVESSNLKFTTLEIPTWIQNVELKNLGPSRSDKARGDLTNLIADITSFIDKRNQITLKLDQLKQSGIIDFRQIAGEKVEFEITYLRYNQEVTFIMDSDGNVTSKPKNENQEG